jgi:hypothetical protein
LSEVPEGRMFINYIVPESYRWLAINGKIKEAHAVMAKIAKWNGKSEPNITEFTTVVELHRKTINEKKYTLIDVLRRPSSGYSGFFHH